MQLTLVNAATSLKRTAITDAKGRFQFLQLAPAEWLLVVEAAGCKRVSIPVVVQVNQVTQLE